MINTSKHYNLIRQKAIADDFLKDDRIWPPGIPPGNFVEALKEVLGRLPADAYEVVSQVVSFVVEDNRFAAINVPFNRPYPPTSNEFTVKFDTIIVFRQALAYPHAALMGLLAHELAHSVVSEPDYKSDEVAADDLILRWGFNIELEALRAQHKKAKDDS